MAMPIDQLIDRYKRGYKTTELWVAMAAGLAQALSAAFVPGAPLNKQLTNLTWVVGDAVPLPFPVAAFSAVVTRYSFHHFLDPRAVLAGMVRVCAPGGAQPLSAKNALARWIYPTLPESFLSEALGDFSVSRIASS